MKFKDKISLGIEDFKNLRMPFSIKIFLYIIPFLILLFLFYYFQKDYDFIPNDSWIPILIFVQTIIIIVQLVMIRNQGRYNRIPYLPEFKVKPEYIEKSKNKGDGYLFTLYNKGNIAYLVNYKIFKGEKRKKIKDEFIEEKNKGGKEKIYEFMNKEEFINNEIRVNIGYCDKTGYHLYSRWYKLTGKKDFIAILTGLDQ